MPNHTHKIVIKRAFEHLIQTGVIKLNEIEWLNFDYDNIKTDKEKFTQRNDGLVATSYSSEQSDLKQRYDR